MNKLSATKQIFALLITAVLMSVFAVIQVSVCLAVTIFADDPVESNSARALAMGAASIVIADGNTSHLSNPAALILVSRSVITGGLHLDQVSEERFDDNEQELDNSQVYFNPLHSQGLVIRNGDSYTGALSRGMLFDYYSKREEVMETASSSYESIGGLYAISASAAKQVVPKLAIGGSLNILRGDRDIESRYTEEWEDWDWDYEEEIPKQDTYSWTTEQTESGFNVSLGGLYTLNEKLQVGVAYRTSADVTRKTKTTVKESGESGDTDSTKDKWTYPVSMGAGAAYRHEQFLFVGEIHRTNWSDFEWRETGGSPIRPDYVKLTTFHVGLEYEASMPSLSSEPVLLRCGFYTAPFHFLEELSMDETDGYFVTAGIGINSGDFRIDIGGQIGKKTFGKPEREEEYEASIKSVLGTISYLFDLSE